MTRSMTVAIVSACLAIAVPVSAVVAFAQPTPEDNSGICTDLGCKGGTAKCADGTLTYPNGGSATYTCYTTTPAPKPE